MPTVLLLDVSLSMSRPVPSTESSESLTRCQIAISAINAFLDQLYTTSKLEFVSLVIFSSRWEVLVPFTRDYGEVRIALTKLEDYSRTCIEAALSAAKSVIVEEWGSYATAQVLLITDGRVGLGEGSLRQSLANYRHPQTTSSLRKSDVFPLPFPFPSTLHIVCIAPHDDPSLDESLPMYHRLIELNQGDGYIHQLDGPLTFTTAGDLLAGLVNQHFKSLRVFLKCGNLKSQTLIYPPPASYNSSHDFETVNKSVSSTLEICGFVEITDISSPPYISRHLIMPTLPNSEELEGGAEEVRDDSPAFTVLLHGALKVEGMVALVQLAEDWFGMIYSWADSKKKSSLMLSVFKPGVNELPWLGNLNHLAPVSDFSSPPFGEENNKTPFPVRPVERHSYAQNCVVWIKPSGLQADLQKILRNARKLPEKQPHFYKEINRFRRAALSFGFHKLLESLAQLLERECALLPANTHPDASLQLTHAATVLRSPGALQYTVNIQPLRTNFTAD